MQNQTGLTIPACAKRIGLSENQVRAILKREPEKLPHIRVLVGKRHIVRIDHQGAEDFIKRHKVA